MTTLNLNEVYQFITNIVHKCGIIINDAYYKEKSVTEKGNFGLNMIRIGISWLKWEPNDMVNYSRKISGLFRSIFLSNCHSFIHLLSFCFKILYFLENFADFVTETDKLVEKSLIEAIKQKYPTHKYSLKCLFIQWNNRTLRLKFALTTMVSLRIKLGF